MIKESKQNNNTDNYYNVVNDSDTDNVKKKSFFEQEVDNNNELTLKTTLNPKAIKAMKSKILLWKMKLWSGLKEKRQQKKIEFFDWSSCHDGS